MAVYWKATALEAEVWVQTIMEGKQRFMVACQTSRGEERGSETGKVAIAHGRSLEPAKRHQWPSRRTEEILYGHETDRDRRSAYAASKCAK